MSPQADYVVSNGTGAAVRSDINGQLAAIVSNNSGASAPATTYAYMLWADTSTNLLKLRNGANSAWITVGDLTATNLGLAALASPTFTGTVTIPTATISTGAGIPLASAASPAIYFTGDTNTGIYSPGADQFAITTGGSGRLFVDSSGRVGLGTSSPSNGRLNVSAASNQITVDWNNDQTTYGRLDVGHFTNGAFIGTVAGTDAAANLLRLGTGGTERVRIDSSGRVGIGTTAPSQLLELNGASNPCLLIKDTTNNVIAYTFADDNVANFGSASAHPVVFRINNNEAARIDASSRLLVGTSSSINGDTVQIAGSGPALGIGRFVASVSGPDLNLFKSRSGTVGTNTVVQSGDILGNINFNGGDGTNYITAALIRSEVDGTPGANDMPGRLVFSTTADGASSPTERVRVTSGGYFKASNDGFKINIIIV